VAHFDSERSLDVRLTRQVIRARRSELKADERITLRASGSDWLEVRLDTESDVELALSLVEQAVAANLPDAEPGPPPTGAELARRRRFH
jgi:2,4-dienoyl-CoA reductase-like NADH-dependent reductase (Old Yellow Enzyme family)